MQRGASTIALRRELLRHDDGGITALDWVESCGGDQRGAGIGGAFLSSHTTLCERRDEGSTYVSGVDASALSKEDNVPVVVLLHTITGEVVE